VRAKWRDWQSIAIEQIENWIIGPAEAHRGGLSDFWVHDKDAIVADNLRRSPMKNTVRTG